MTAERMFAAECPACGRRWALPEGLLVPVLIPPVPAHHRDGASCPGAGGRARDVEVRVRHYLGLDLGQSQDYTALAVVERTDVADVLERFRAEGHPTHTRYRTSLYAVRKLERLALATAYPTIVRHVITALRDPRLVRAVLVVDKTGVGAPIVDLFRQAGLAPVAVTITGGQTTTATGGGVGVPKRDLVHGTLALLQEGTLKIAAGLRLAEALVEELVNFRVEISQSGRDTYEARQGVHDDLVLAVALATWRARGDTGALRRALRPLPPDFTLLRV